MSATLLEHRTQTLRLNPVAPFPSQYAHAKRMIKEARDGLVHRCVNGARRYHPDDAVPANDMDWRGGRLT